MVDNILLWINQNPHWAGMAVFLIAFLESLAIIGLAMPGWLLLVGVGSLIGGGSLNFWLMSLCSFAGAFLGQAISYGFGYYYQEKIHHWRWVENHTKLMDKAEIFFKRHGFAGILFGQFIGPIRAVISLVAGILGMAVKQFLLAITIAALIWAPLYLMPGVLLGAALTFEKTQIWILIASVLSIIICFWLISRFLIDFLKTRKTSFVEGEKNKLPKRRYIAATFSLLGLSAVVIFLLASDYGSLMLELLQKIWRVVS